MGAAFSDIDFLVFHEFQKNRWGPIVVYFSSFFIFRFSKFFSNPTFQHKFSFFRAELIFFLLSFITSVIFQGVGVYGSGSGKGFEWVESGLASPPFQTTASQRVFFIPSSLI